MHHPPLRSLALALLFASALAPAAGAEPFPRPAGLEPDVRFWVRIYSEVDTQGGLIHDATDLGVVYDVVRFGDRQSPRAREQQTDSAKKEIAAALRALAKGKRSGLSRRERHVLAQFPDGVSNRTLAEAARNVRFQLGQADKFRAGIVRSGAWHDHIEGTFREMGLPTELASLPHVESSFRHDAQSHVGAAGLWQFMRSTGRRYMSVDHVVDERLDPFESTRAAAKLLAANKQVTGTWPLALVAYNHGAAGMRRAARTVGTTDIETILRKYRSRTFGFASRNFYVEFLAAREVETNAERYFGPIRRDAPVAYDRIELPFYAKASSLASAIGVPVETLRAANPALSRLVWSGQKFVPRGFALRVPSAELARPLALALDDLAADQRFAAQTADRTHRVRRGDTLSGIAARYGTSVRELAAANKLRSHHTIRVGQVLRLPHGGGVVLASAKPAAKAKPSRSAKASAPAAPPPEGVYTVRRGDTLASIARRFGTTERELLAANDVRDRNRIYPGQSLRVGADAPEPAAPPSAITLAAATAPIEREEPAAANAPSAAAIALAEVAAVDVAPGPDAAPSERDAARDASPASGSPSEALAADDAGASDGDGDGSSDGADASANAGATASADEGAADDAADEPATELAADETTTELARDLLADPADYSVADDGTIEVQPTETLGHIAEWLDVRASRLRQLNRLRFGTPIAVHQRLRLDFERVARDEFERRRLQHHRALQTEYFERYEITGTREHVVRRGDSVWVLAQRSNVPLWLLQQYNPDLEVESLSAGAKLTLPVVRRHQPS
ncbi:MAG: LysM peptidoglycan-binding domain-containing protein [Myxococcota bacterium]